MSEKFTTPSPKANGPTSTSEWDFVKDTSLEKTTQPRVVLNKEGRPETVNYTYIDNHPDTWDSAEEPSSPLRPFSIDQLSKLSGSTDQNELTALQLDHDKLRELIAKKVGDEDDLEKIDYYLKNPSGAIHDLVDAPQKFKERAEKGDLLPEQIIGANEKKYDKLLTRLAILEQNYPALKNRRFSAMSDVPRDVDREWVLTKRYLELLSEPTEDLNSQTVKKYELTDSGEVIKDGRKSNINKIATFLESYTKKNKGLIDESVDIPERANPYKGTVEWLSKVEAANSLRSLNTLEKDFKTALNTQYSLRARQILGDKVNDIIKEKRIKFELASATKARDGFIEKYKDHLNDLTGINPADAQAAHNQAKQNLEFAKNDFESAKKTLIDLRKNLDKIPSYRKIGPTARSLKRQITTQEKLVENLSTQLSNAHQQYDLAHDRMQFCEINARISQLTQSQQPQPQPQPQP